MAVFHKLIVEISYIYKKLSTVYAINFSKYHFSKTVTIGRIILQGNGCEMKYRNKYYPSMAIYCYDCPCSMTSEAKNCMSIYIAVYVKIK